MVEVSMFSIANDGFCWMDFGVHQNVTDEFWNDDKFQTKRPDSILKTKPNKLICYQILPIVHQIVDENCRQFLNNYEK